MGLDFQSAPLEWGQGTEDCIQTGLQRTRINMKL